MQRFHQIAFIVSVIALCWLLMMAVHELGHVIGAWATGGTVQRVVLNPLTISRTDVAPNPRPGVVVWLGPVVGCVLPMAVAAAVPRRWGVLRNIAWFFAGFCLIANGAYIALGTFDRIGDCGEMLRAGTPMWVMFAIGLLTIPLGLWIWHRMGSLKSFLRNASLVTPAMATVAVGSLVVLVIVESLCSPR